MPPSSFAVHQRLQQEMWKSRSVELSDEARAAGRFRGIPLPYVLPIATADQNLWSGVRAALLGRFSRDVIAWHDGSSHDYGARESGGPSPHLLDSQVCCLNFWCGLERSPDALTAVLRRALPNVERAVAPVDRGAFVEPEWIGVENYLGERGARRRGAYATSADLLLAYEDNAGVRHGVLLESKYTESYVDAAACRFSARGTDRLATYLAALTRPDSPIVLPTGVSWDALFYEPFYQHLRQQLLAASMEGQRELGFVTVTVLHVAPAANRAFHASSIPVHLRPFGQSVADVWRLFLREPSRYVSVAYEDLFAAAEAAASPPLSSWVSYQRERYSWGIPG